MNQNPVPIRAARSRRGADKTAMDFRSHRHEIWMVLCLGLLGSGAALVLRPNPVVTGVAIGILVTCLLVIVVRSLRRASRRIDSILREQVEAEAAAPVERHRKTA